MGAGDAPDGVKTTHGWLTPLENTTGYRFRFNDDFGAGGVEWRSLPGGLLFGLVDAKFRTGFHAQFNPSPDGLFSFGVAYQSANGRFVGFAEGGLPEGGAAGYFACAQGGDLSFEVRPGGKLRAITIMLPQSKLPDLWEGFDGAPPALLNDSNGDKNIMAADIPLTPQYLKISRDCLDCEFSGKLRTDYFRAKAQELTCLLLASISDDGAPKEKLYNKLDASERVKRIERLMDENIAQPFTLEDAAERLGVNPRTVMRDFKAVHGVAFGAYYRELRLREASHLILETNIPMTDIAFAVGFQQASSFTSAFRSRFGEAPSDFRRKRKLASR